MTSRPTCSVFDEGADNSPGPTSQQRDEAILEAVYPQLVNDVGILVGKPFRLIWDPSVETASTDCQAEVRIAPWFFLAGYPDVGFGTSYHEGGHIVFSPYGTKLLRRAYEAGGSVLKSIANIILDRKDDILNARYAPGFAPRLRRRLEVLCTLTKQDQYRDVLSRVPPEDLRAVLKSLHPENAFEDFFYAAKWHRRERFRVTEKAMRLLRPKRLLTAGEDELLYIAQRVLGILGSTQPDLASRQKKERQLVTLVLIANSTELNGGQRLNPAVARILAKLAQQHVEVVRVSGLKQLERVMRSLGSTHPGPISVGEVSEVPMRPVPASAEFEGDYQMLLAGVSDQVGPLMNHLRRIDHPSEFTIYGQDEGELDLSASAFIATGLSGYHKETVVERDIDADIHLGLDCSSSMSGPKLEQAKRIATVFSEAILLLSPAVTGRIWSFNSSEICDFGPVSRQSGFVRLECAAANSDSHFLPLAGRELARSPKRRKILILLCDDGPDSVAKASEISRQLMARGIIVIHLLVGVHGTPKVYPIELLYSSMQECLELFGDVIVTVMNNLR